MRICYDNLWDDHTIVAASENSNYPASNTQDQRLQRYTKTTAILAQTWDIDLGVATDISCVAIANHNFTSGATIELRASVNSDYSTTDYSYTITYDSDIMLDFFTVQSYRYWRIYVNDAANGDGFLKMGRVYLGEYLDVVPSSDLPVDYNPTRTDQITFSQGGQVYRNKGSRSDEFGFTWTAMPGAMRISMEAFFDDMGYGTPFFFCNYNTHRTIFDVYYTCLTDYKSRYLGENKFYVSIAIKETN